MRIEVRFRHMDRSESLEAFTLEKVGQAVEEFSHRHDPHVQVWLISDLNLSNRGTGEFLCEIEVRYPRKKHFFISKSAPDMHVAIQDSVDRLKTLLDEAGKRELDHRHDDARERASL
jgi:ribosome-associated translation inhibitor RaiA